MTDIVERLRRYALNVSSGIEAQAKETLTWQAADEIERLKADKDVQRSQARNAAYEADNERLRALCEELFDLHGDNIATEYLEELERRVRALEPKP